MTTLADKYRQSWCYWGNWNETGVRDILSRMYPQLIAGELINFVESNEELRIEYNSNGGTSVIFIGNRNVNVTSDCHIVLTKYVGDLLQIRIGDGYRCLLTIK
jgi:hypothetical protein